MIYFVVLRVGPKTLGQALSVIEGSAVPNEKRFPISQNLKI
jgi:hypothetical protein